MTSDDFGVFLTYLPRSATGAAPTPGQAKTTRPLYSILQNQGKTAVLPVLPHMAPLQYLPTYPNQILYYMSLYSKIRCSLTYLPT